MKEVWENIFFWHVAITRLCLGFSLPLLLHPLSARLERTGMKVGGCVRKLPFFVIISGSLPCRGKVPFLRMSKKLFDREESL